MKSENNCACNSYVNVKPQVDQLCSHCAEGICQRRSAVTTPPLFTHCVFTVSSR